ncbi:hypothetical protein T01_12199 [Trichinella spiralis]|uniref:Uncharacterized protein n=1 Tax=Trichinella spiralis TaxID=6334 RepID=A0A0V0XJ17_TRISP|nr:hypothetical protein T01_12199 [Trichinella spiralis]
MINFQLESKVGQQKRKEGGRTCRMEGVKVVRM